MLWSNKYIKIALRENRVHYVERRGREEMSAMRMRSVAHLRTFVREWGLRGWGARHLQTFVREIGYTDKYERSFVKQVDMGSRALTNERSWVRRWHARVYRNAWTFTLKYWIDEAHNWKKDAARNCKCITPVDIYNLSHVINYHKIRALQNCPTKISEA